MPATGSTVTPDQEINYNVTLTNTGSTDLINLTIHDDLSDVLDDANLVGDPTVSPDSAGTATVTDGALQFDGDIAAGQSVTISYTVKVKSAIQLGNKTMQNFVIAAHSNCHPTISNQTVTVDNPDCTTTHTVEAGTWLAPTGQNLLTWVAVSSVLFALSAALLRYRNRIFSRS